MATLNQKATIIDLFNDTFISLGVNESSKEYESFFDNATDRVVNQFDSNTKMKDVKKIVNRISLDNKAYINQVYSMVVLSAVTGLIMQTQLNKSDKVNFAPIKRIMSQYRRPTTLAIKINKFTKALTSNNFKSITVSEQNAFKDFLTYTKTNQKAIKRTIKINETRIKQANAKMKLDVSRKTFKEVIRQTKERKIVTVAGEEVKRPLTKKELSANVKSKLKGQTDWKVKRVLDTELHAMSENAKIVHHQILGYTHKRNFTEGDRRVRDTHKVQQGKIYKIDQEFRLGSFKGQFYGDNSFGTERINCRCWHEYFRK